MNKYYTGLTALIAATFLFGCNPQNTTKEDVRAMEERLPVFLGSNEALHAVSAVESAGRWLLAMHDAAPRTRQCACGTLLWHGKLESSSRTRWARV